MPNIKSAKKRVRLAEESRKRNKGIKTRIKNITRKLKEEKSPKKKEELLKLAYSVVDKAVRRRLFIKTQQQEKKLNLLAWLRRNSQDKSDNFFKACFF